MRRNNKRPEVPHQRTEVGAEQGKSAGRRDGNEMAKLSVVFEEAALSGKQRDSDERTGGVA
jgi:hypothetical protein